MGLCIDKNHNNDDDMGEDINKVNKQTSIVNLENDL